MNIDASDWKEFEVTDLFSVKGCKKTPAYKLDQWKAGVYPHITTTSKNNGVIGLYDHYTEKGKVITFESASIGSFFYQQLPFSAGEHVMKLEPKFKITYTLAMFLCTILNMEKTLFSYGRKCNIGNVSQNKTIKLPIQRNADGTPKKDKTYSSNGKLNYIPDWYYMDQYIRSLNYKPIKTHTKKHIDLWGITWGWFRLEELFDIKRGRAKAKNEYSNGLVRMISGTKFCNGVSSHVDLNPNFAGNILTISNNGSVGEVFYQEVPVYGTDAVTCLISKYSGFNQYHGLFIATVLRLEGKKYMHGNKLTNKKIKNIQICLPKNVDVPDYDFMEKYMKSLYFSEKLEW